MTRVRTQRLLTILAVAFFFSGCETTAQSETDRVGQEPWGEQERARDETHGAVGQRPPGNDPLGHLQPHLEPGFAALVGNERGPEDCRRDHDGHGGPEADGLPDPEEQGDLDQRNHEERNEEDGPDSHPPRILVPAG